MSLNHSLDVTTPRSAGLPVRSRKKPVSAVPAPGPRKETALINAMMIVAHDLRGPLANLAVMLELIEAYNDRRAHEQVSPCARKAGRLVETLDAMLQGFLERTRVTGDPLGFSPRLLDIGDVLQRAITLSGPLAESRSITIERSGAAALAVQGDAPLLIEAVDNVLGNAIKFSEAGSVVRCVAGRDGKDAVIRIFDSGPGFSDNDLARAFRPFMKLSARPAGPDRSTGLGLWIAKLIATRHGGTIEIAPRSDGAGSVMTLRLPACLR